MRRHVALLVLGIAAWATGCVQYVSVPNLYDRHPDLAQATGSSGAGVRSDSAQVVYADAVGQDCDAVAAQAVRNLIGKARALGGARVAQPEFRGWLRWTPVPQCRVSSGASVVQTRGVVIPP